MWGCGVSVVRGECGVSSAVLVSRFHIFIHAFGVIIFFFFFVRLFFLALRLVVPIIAVIFLV